VTTPINRRDIPFAALIIAFFLFGVVFSWQRWGNPLVDCGREMNQPLRLANGEMLYSEVRHIYGPLSPYLNAFLYKLFGESLNVLYSGGIISAIIILTLSYWIARQLMNRYASTAATLSVMWLCAFKQAGNYILPYSYSALHGCAFGLATLAMLIKATDSLQAAGSNHTEDSIDKDDNASVSAELTDKPDQPAVSGNSDTGSVQVISQNGQRPTYICLLLAGFFSALTLLAKTEMGVAAIAAGLVTAAIIGYPNIRRAVFLLAIFILPAIAITFAVYGFILSRVGWYTFSHESYLLLQNVPLELVYFNKRMSGFDRPLESIVSIIGALLRIILLMVAVASISHLITRRGGKKNSLQQVALTESGSTRIIYLWGLLVLSIALIISLSFTGIMSWDSGPYLAMPILLVVLLIPETRNFLQQASTEALASRQTILIIITGTYAFASLARVILRVRSGGAYSSYLLPISVILFTYILSYQFTRYIKERPTRVLARNILIGLIMADAIVTAGLLAHRYRVRNTYPIVTARGTMLAVPDLGATFEQAIAFINRETSPDDSIAVMPEGTSLLFLTNRKNPLREEITTPGFLDRAGEERAIRQLTESNTRYILIANRATSEFGATIFGRDYCQHLMDWIKNNYEESTVFSPEGNKNFQIGDKVFFIKAYRKKLL
jgi:hypothetical protein